MPDMKRDDQQLGGQFPAYREQDELPWPTNQDWFRHLVLWVSFLIAISVTAGVAYWAWQRLCEAGQSRRARQVQSSLERRTAMPKELPKTTLVLRCPACQAGEINHRQVVLNLNQPFEAECVRCGVDLHVTLSVEPTLRLVIQQVTGAAS